MEDYTNAVIQPASLPPLAELAFEPLAPAFRTLRCYDALLKGLIFVAAASIIFGFSHRISLGWYLLSIIIILLWVALRCWHAYASYAHYGVCLRQHDIVVKKGMWWRTITALPFNRLQHLEVHRGPIEQRLGLASLKLFTAGGASVDLLISGLTLQSAEQLKGFLLAQADNLEANTTEPGDEQS